MLGFAIAQPNLQFTTAESNKQKAIALLFSRCDRFSVTWNSGDRFRMGEGDRFLGCFGWVRSEAAAPAESLI